MWEITIFLGTFLCLLYIYLAPKRPPNFPPGPPGYPVVGSGFYLSKLGKIADEKFGKLGEIFGSISGIFLGPNRTIVVNGYEATKNFYACDAFAGRPKIFSVDHRWDGRSLGIIFSSGSLWHQNRRFTLRHLRDFGFGKTSMEGLIHEECEECIKSILKEIKAPSSGSVVTLNNRFNISMINILWAIIGGQRYSHDDENLKRLMKTIHDSFRAGNPGGILLGLLNGIPALRHLPYFKRKYKEIRNGMDALCEMLESTIDEHSKTRDPAAPRDFIDVYLQAMDETKSEEDSAFFKEQLIQTCGDLFSAGADTTANSVAFSLLHMLVNPECQKKVHDELDAVVGKDRLPSLNDKEALPYTFAVITESFRLTPSAPLSVPHYSIENVHLMGFDIPKGTWAIVNFSTTNKDKAFWGDPLAFRPDRFLDENGAIIKSKVEHVFGFGAGKRQCLGEPLAKINTFLLFAAILQRFHLEVPEGQPTPSIEALPGFTVAPQPFSAKITVRS